MKMTLGDDGKVDLSYLAEEAEDIGNLMCLAAALGDNQPNYHKYMRAIGLTAALDGALSLRVKAQSLLWGLHAAWQSMLHPGDGVPIVLGHGPAQMARAKKWHDQLKDLLGG